MPVVLVVVGGAHVARVDRRVAVDPVALQQQRRCVGLAGVADRRKGLLQRCAQVRLGGGGRGEQRDDALTVVLQDALAQGGKDLLPKDAFQHSGRRRLLAARGGRLGRLCRGRGGHG